MGARIKPVEREAVSLIVLAQRMEEKARRGQVVHLLPETSLRVAAELRSHAASMVAPVDLKYRIEHWRGDHIERVLALVASHPLAMNTYQNACILSPRTELTLREGARLLAASEPAKD
jgi:hypothetical protein